MLNGHAPTISGNESESLLATRRSEQQILAVSGPTTTIRKPTTSRARSTTGTHTEAKRSTAISPTLLSLTQMSQEEMLQIATSSPTVRSSTGKSWSSRSSRRVTSTRVSRTSSKVASRPASCRTQRVTNPNTCRETLATINEIHPSVPEAPIIISAAAALLVVFLLYVIVFLKVSFPDKERPSKKGSPFCCPLEAEIIAGYINHSIPPCDNFRDFVCYKYDRKTATNYDLNVGIRNDILQGISMKKSPVAAVLSRLHETCIATTSDNGKLVYQLATAIINNPSLPLFEFAVAMNLGYNLATGIRISRRRSENGTGVDMMISKEVQSIRQLDNFCTSCLGELIRACNAYAGNGNLTTEILDRIDEMAAAPHTSRNRNNTQIGNLTLICDILNNSACVDWVRTFKHVWIDPEQINATIVGGEDVNALIAEMRSNWGYIYTHARSYLVAQATISAFHHINPTRHVSSNQHIITNCVRIVKEMVNIWDLVYMQLFTDPEKDRHVRNVYIMVMESFRTELKSTNILDAQDRPKALQKVGNLSLLLPSDTALSFIALPDVTDNFGENYFGCLLHELLARNTKALNRLPEIRYSDVGEVDLYFSKYMAVSPQYYAYLNFNNATSIFLNMPSLGVQFAMRAWFFLLADRSWSEASLAKLDTVLACFKSSAENDSSFVDYDTVALAAALRTVRRLLVDDAWYTQKAAWSLWRLSNSQFFYIRYAFRLCSNGSTCASCQINLPLKHTKDFFLSFRCPVKSIMSAKQLCSF